LETFSNWRASLELIRLNRLNWRVHPIAARKPDRLATRALGFISVKWESSERANVPRYPQNIANVACLTRTQKEHIENISASPGGHHMRRAVGIMQDVSELAALAAFLGMIAMVARSLGG
jgi:hypothetical protein